MPIPNFRALIGQEEDKEKEPKPQIPKYNPDPTPELPEPPQEWQSGFGNLGQVGPAGGQPRGTLRVAPPGQVKYGSYSKPEKVKIPTMAPNMGSGGGGGATYTGRGATATGLPNAEMPKFQPPQYPQAGQGPDTAPTMAPYYNPNAQAQVKSDLYQSRGVYESDFYSPPTDSMSRVLQEGMAELFGVGPQQVEPDMRALYGADMPQPRPAEEPDMRALLVNEWAEGDWWEDEGAGEEVYGGTGYGGGYGYPPGYGYGYGGQDYEREVKSRRPQFQARDFVQKLINWEMDI